MNTAHYEAGRIAAQSGEFRAAPSNLKIITQPWRDWYAGYDEATESGDNKKLTSNYSLKANSAQCEASL